MSDHNESQEDLGKNTENDHEEDGVFGVLGGQPQKEEPQMTAGQKRSQLRAELSDAAALSESTAKFTSVFSSTGINKMWIVIIIASYAIAIAGIVVAICLGVSAWIKWVIAIGAVAILFACNLAFKQAQKKERDKRLNYAYEFRQKLQESYDAGNLQKQLEDGFGAVVTADFFEQMGINPYGHIIASGRLKNGLKFNMTIAKVSIELEFEGSNIYDIISLLFPDNVKTNEADRDGYARKGEQPLVEDLCRIVNDKAEQDNSEEDE